MYDEVWEVPRLPYPLTRDFMNSLIDNGAVSRKNLLDGKTYVGKCRNAHEAVWHEDKEKFTYRRTKFGSTFDEDINHFEDDDGFDLFVPIGLKEGV